MAWKKAEEAEKELTIETLLKKETTWNSYYGDIEHWEKILKEGHYSLVGEYAIDEQTTLYRYELNEKFRKELGVNASHIQNVVITNEKKDKEAKDIQV